MILVLQKNTPEPAIRQLLAQLALQNVKGGCVAGETSLLLPLVGETWRLDPAALQALPYVQEARRLTPAYHLAARSAHPENTVVPVGDVRVGADFCLIAGPCAVESAYQIQTVAAAVKAAGAVILRGGAFKPRTSPYTFQGLGEQGTALLVQAGRDTGLPTVTEITDPAQLDTLADVDVLQVGARNMQNFALLKALGRTRKPILLKRGTSATVEELLLSAEYILSGGNTQVILCERGIRSGLTPARAALDVSAVPVLKRLTHLPVIVDPSHAAGRADLVEPLASAAPSTMCARPWPPGPTDCWWRSMTVPPPPCLTAPSPLPPPPSPSWPKRSAASAKPCNKQKRPPRRSFFTSSSLKPFSTAGTARSRSARRQCCRSGR